MRGQEWMYRLMLQLYPPDFRASFEREMVLLYRDQRREGVVNARFWMSFVAETLGNAPRLWVEELRDGLLNTEAAVKVMGLLTLLIGALETLNSLVESRSYNFGSRDSLAQLLLVLAIASAVLLTLSGLALIFRGPSARRTGWIAAVFCLGTFILMAATRPMMSVAAMLVGVAFPLVMMAFLFARRDRPIA